MSEPVEADAPAAAEHPESSAAAAPEAAAAVPVADPMEVVAAPTATPAEAVAPLATPNPMLEKYNEYWNIVKENPSDFQTWTLLISTTEKLEDIEKSRAVFDSFLSEYPLCYGYWKKYADAEVKNGNAELAGHVYERGVSSIPYSVDLWGHFVAYKQSTGATPDEIRGFFERGLAYVATDYSAHTLWDKYIQFETAQGGFTAVGAIYTRILRCPLKELERYQNSLKDWVANHTASDIMTAEELSAYNTEMVSQKEAERVRIKEAAAAAKAAAAVAILAEPKAEEGAEEGAKPAEAEAGDQDMPDAEGSEQPSETTAAAVKAEAALEEAGVKPEAEASASEVPPDASEVPPDANGHAATMGKEGSTGQAEGGTNAAAAEGDTAATPAAAKGDTAAAPAADAAAASDASTAEAPAAEVEEGPISVTEEEVKQAWLQAREELCSSTKEELAKRKPFEEAIRRAYFHVKALDAAQLNNWNRYLTFIEQHGDEAAIITLYERCLVACASYPEFWQRYIRLMESINMEHATGALQRAVVIYCKRRPEMHLFAAHFEERHGDLENARRNHKYILTELSPRLLSAVTAAANFEARQGNQEAACAYFEDLIREERSKENSKIYTHLCIQYAHFLRHKYAAVEKGRAVLAEALEQSPAMRSLWEAAIFFEEAAAAPDMVTAVLSLYARASDTPDDPAKGLQLKEREELSLRSVEFADQYGDPKTLYEAEKAHTARFLLPTALTTVKKRPADIMMASAAKAPRMDGGLSIPLPPGPPPAMPAPPQMPAYYGQQPAAAPAAAAAGYNYAAYYAQYPQYAGYGYGY